MVQSVGDILEERGKRYGQFINHAGVSQGIQQVIEFGMQVTGKTRFDFYVDELEALAMISNKLGRIVNGDPHWSDSWRDIAGYATLVADRLDNDMAQQKLTEEQTYERSGDAEQAEPDSSYNGTSEARGDFGQEESQRVERPSRPTGRTELRRVSVDGTSEETPVTVRTTPRG